MVTIVRSVGGSLDAQAPPLHWIHEDCRPSLACASAGVQGNGAQTAFFRHLRWLDTNNVVVISFPPEISP